MIIQQLGHHFRVNFLSLLIDEDLSDEEVEPQPLFEAGALSM